LHRRPQKTVKLRPARLAETHCPRGTTTILEQPRHGIVRVSGVGACIGFSLRLCLSWRKDQAALGLHGRLHWWGRGLPKDWLAQVLGWIRYPRKLREQILPPHVRGVHSLLRLRLLRQRDCGLVLLVRSLSVDLRDLRRGCPGGHRVVIGRPLFLEGVGVLFRSRATRELLHPVVHAHANHLHDLKDPSLLSILRYENRPHRVGALGCLLKIDWLWDVPSPGDWLSPSIDVPVPICHIS